MRSIHVVLCLAVLSLGGCYATRLLEVHVPRNVLDTRNRSRVTDQQALAIFQDAAQQLGLAVSAPIRVSDQEVEYEAIPSKTKPERAVSLILDLRADQADFLIQIWGTAGEFSKAKEAAIPIRKVLDERGIKYKIIERHSFFWGP